MKSSFKTTQSVIASAILLFCTCCLMGCKSETRITGEVFVVTEGAGNYKLGLVTVSAVPADDVSDLMDEQRQSLNASAKKLKEIAGKCKYLSDKRHTDSQNVDLIEMGLSDIIERENSEILDCNTRLDLEKSKARDDFFGRLPDALVSATTNSDGKFSLILSGEKDYVLAAAGQRKVEKDKTERYYWLVRVKPTGGEMSILLSNNNMMGDPLTEPIISIK